MVYVGLEEARATRRIVLSNNPQISQISQMKMQFKHS